MEPSLISLPLKDMHLRHRGLTPALAECYLEAARVCLDRHHVPPQEFELDDTNIRNQVFVEWEQTDARAKAAWANVDDATRDGAYPCALAAVELTRGLVAIGRAETRTGADYYVAPIGQGIEDLENSYRVEVSGTNSNSVVVKSRLHGKMEQARSGQSNLPALAAVVGFRVRLIMIQPAE